MAELFPAGTQTPHSKPLLETKTIFGITARESPVVRIFGDRTLSFIPPHVHLFAFGNIFCSLFFLHYSYLSFYHTFVLPSLALYFLGFLHIPSFASVPSSRFTLLLSQLSRMRTALFWAIRQRVIVIPSRSLDASEQPIQFLTLEDGTDRLSRNVGKGLPLHAA